MKFDQHPNLIETYKSLKFFKSLLYLDPSQILNPEHTNLLPKLVLIQNLFVRAVGKIKGARELNGWSIYEYFEAVDDEAESWGVFRRCLEVYVEEVKRKGDTHYCVEFPVLKALLE
jgi:hypothetical protein